MDVSMVGKGLVVAGLVLAAVGAALWLVGKAGAPFGHLPGDIAIQRGHFSLYVPVTACIVVSIVLTLLIHLVGRFLSR